MLAARHAEIARLLGLPAASVGFCWTYLEASDAPAYTEILTFEAPPGFVWPFGLEGA